MITETTKIESVILALQNSWILAEGGVGKQSQKHRSSKVLVLRTKSDGVLFKIDFARILFYEHSKFTIAGPQNLKMSLDEGLERSCLSNRNCVRQKPAREEKEKRYREALHRILWT